MQIAFVGKGGSGKTTLCTLFIRSLLATGKQVLALDADINMHLAQALGVPGTSSKALSSPDNAVFVREYLRGTNPRIPSAEAFLKTTPPGRGSRSVRVEGAHPIILALGTAFDSNGWLLHVGTYEKEDIGTSCYHGNLSVAENLLSHAVTDAEHWVVTDMVAGTDAFSNTLHAQFDHIFLVVEPTPEGVGVFRQYKELAMEAQVWDRISVIGNKIETPEDAAYLKQHVGDALVACVPALRAIRSARQNDELLFPEALGLSGLYADLIARVAATATHKDSKLPRLYELHRAYASQPYAQKMFGDLVGQIDDAFSYDSFAPYYATR